jgi:hypothetical protein
MVDIMSGKPNSGFPGRKVRQLCKALSLGGESEPASCASTEGLETPSKAAPAEPLQDKVDKADKADKDDNEDPEHRQLIRINCLI